jgi:hypothetical protein
MATYYCDTGLASGDNDGTTMDDAYRTIKAAFERNAYGAGDILWVRRRSAHTNDGADITPNAASDGTTIAPIRFVGWPRTTKAVTSSDWTQGSTAVVIDDADMSRGHLGRWITAPDGKQYLITHVVDASNIVIDREYVGSTVTNQNATIAADEDYTEAQAIDDSAWTIKKTAWNGDAHTLPTIDFGANAYQLNITGTNGPWVLANLDFLDSTDSAGVISATGCRFIFFTGCLFYQSQNSRIITTTSIMAFITRCIITGAGSGNAQRLLYLTQSFVYLKDSAVYAAGVNAMYAETSTSVELNNVNIGVEASDAAYDIRKVGFGSFIGLDVKLGGTNGLIELSSDTSRDNTSIKFDNYGKILGAQRRFTAATQTSARKAVVAGSGDPYKRSGGSDDVLEIFRNYSGGARAPGWENEEIRWRFWADTTSKSYRVYCQQVAMSTLTAAQAFLEATYVDEYADATAYHTARVVSDETITVRSGADDWDQYLEVTGIQPAVAGWVTIRLMVQWYDVDGYLYVDPLVVIT